MRQEEKEGIFCQCLLACLPSVHDSNAKQRCAVPIGDFAHALFFFRQISEYLFSLPWTRFHKVVSFLG